MQFQSAYKDYGKTVKLYVDVLAIAYFCFQRFWHIYQMLLPFFFSEIFMGIYRRFKIKLMQWLIPVADPGFPRGGGANSPEEGSSQHAILPKCPKNCMKLKEFGPPGGGGASLTPPLDPPLNPVFPMGGGGRGAYLLFGLIFYKKMHENGISPRGGARDAPPLIYQRDNKTTYF